MPETFRQITSSCHRAATRASRCCRNLSHWANLAVVLTVLGQTTFGLTSCVADDHVIVPGYERFRAEHLSPADAGKLLISELNCQSCHGQFGNDVVPPRQAPVLTKVGERSNADHIRKFITNPQSEKPGTAMPELAALKADPSTADAITAFLTQGAPWRAAAVGVDAVRRGEELFHKVGCAACHADQRSDEVISNLRRGISAGQADEEDEDEQPKPDIKWTRPTFAMPLGKLDQKYSLSSLINFLRDPHAVRPSGRMPSLNLTPEESRDIASYLLKDVDVEANINFEYFEGDWQKVPDFSKLKAISSGTTTDFSVGVSPRKELFALRFSGFLHVPANGNYHFHLSSDDGARLLIDGNLIVDNDGIHPAGFRRGDADLKAGSHELVVEYFEYHGQEELAVEVDGPDLPRQPLAGLITLSEKAHSTKAEPVAAIPAELIEKGRLAFTTLGCAACHQYGEGDQSLSWTGKATPFATMKSTGGCLAEKPDTKVPAFSLSKQQQQDITAAIESARTPGGETIDIKHDIHQTMLTINCYACHSRNSLGGVSEPMNHVFTGSIPEMGDEGRVPPSLDGAGDKLNENWLKTVLNEGAKDRPYMATRMPKFGAQQTGSLLSKLVASDAKPAIEPVTLPEPEHRIKADARLMIGDQALSCIKCHTFDKYAATGIQSLDMTTMTGRLRKEWFHRYLLDPQAYRPGTRMPAAWPKGRSVVPHILNGDSNVQIEAIWTYLLDGKNAKVPSGLQREAIELKPIDRPIIYRNFLEGLSPRGIAVGFAEQVHFAWDAEHMTPRLIWHGAFIDASKHWVDRGPGNQVPLGDHVMTLPAGPPLATLISLDVAWPDSNPRENGFHFKGYSLSKSGLPTFKYLWDDAAVTDTIKPFAASPDNGLQRTMTVKSSKKIENVYLRIASGDNIEEVDGAFIVNGVRFIFDGVEPVVRSINNRRELLLPVTAAAGEDATLKFTVIW